MPQWLLSTSMLSDIALASSRQPCQAQMPSVRLKIAVVGTGRASERSAEARIFLVGAAAAGHLVHTPGVGRLWAGGKRAAKGNHLSHALGHHFGELAGVEATQHSSADQRDRSAMGVVQFMDEIDHCVLHTIT